MSVENFYTNSQHTDSKPVPAATQQQAQQTHADVQKAAETKVEHRAATLFPSMEQGPKQEATPAKVEPDKAAALYDKQYEHALPFVHDMRGVEAEAVEQINTAARESYTALELPVPLAERLTTQFIDAGNKVGTPQEMTDEQHAEARTTMHSELTRRFGADGAKEKLADVRAVLDKVPQLAAVMVDLGLDVNLDTILALAEHSRSMRGRGRLA